MDSYKVMVDKAEEAEACGEAMDQLRKYDSFKAASKDPDAAEWAYWYAYNVIKDRWLQVEAIIIKSEQYAYCYAVDVIEGRWPEAEATIAKSTKYAYCYAAAVIKGKWPEGEAAIATERLYANWYARLVLKCDWPEAGIKLHP